MAGQIVAGSVVVNLAADNRQFNTTLNRTMNVANNFAIRVENVFGRFQDRIIGLAALRTAFAGIPSAFSQVFSVFSGFEAQLSKVQAVSGATAKQMGELREQAKLLGRTTFFTASQVGNAQQMLAQAGFNPEQIKAALPDVLNLALAGDLDIGEAADIATNISTPFGIAADKLNRVNDVLAKAANSSNTNVREMGQAFKYAAPAAAAAGQNRKSG
ncbi:hypothetical protein FACS189427_08120 [Planctomycetales bacterium]|nr:hypothetical protein FACS189427_08120 [Planctomycetales bacterium]